MKKLFFIGFIFSCLHCLAQSEEDTVLDSVLDEIFQIDSMMVDPSHTHYLYTTFSFDESVFFAGRDFDINQFGFTPSISYMKGENFFVSLGSAYFSELDPKWDFISISSGYSLFLDRMKKFSMTGIYSRLFFSSDVEELNSNRLSASMSFRKNRLLIRLSVGYLFGGSTSFYTATSGGYEFPIIDNSKGQVVFHPQLNFLMSEQTVSEQITSGLLNNQTIQTDVFDLINTKLSLPIQCDLGQWDFELSYNINFPKALSSENDLNTNGYFAVSIGYFSAL
jgi:hypothetical protein